MPDFDFGHGTGKYKDSNKSNQHVNINYNPYESQSRVSNTMISTFKLGYSDEEAKAAPQFDRKLCCKVNNEIKNEPQTVIGIGKHGYMKDSACHKRGRTSHYSNERTFGSQVRYLPGSIRDEEDIVIPVPVIRIRK